MRYLRRLLLVLVALVLLLALALHLSADRVFRRQLEARLEATFATEVHLDQVEVDLFSGELSVEGFAVENPDEFGAQPMLSAEKFEAKIRIGSLFSSPLVIEKVLLHSPTVRVAMLADGRVNLHQALRPRESDDEKPEAKGKRLALSVELLEVVGLVLEYEDQSPGGEPVRASLKQFDARLFQLLLGSDGDLPVADLRVTCQLISGDAHAPLMISACAPPPGEDGLRDFHVDLYAAGIDLAPFEEYLTPAATTLLGGRYLDVDLRCDANAGALDGVLGLRSSSGENYRLPIRGTVGAPRLTDDVGVLAAFSLPEQKLGRVWGAVRGGGRRLEAAAADQTGRLVGGARRAAEGLGRAGLDLAGGVGRAGEDLVEGVEQTGKDVAGGLKDVVVDPTRVPEKVVDTAKGVGRQGARLVKGVLGTGKKIAEKVVDTAETGTEEVAGRSGNLAKRLLSLPEMISQAENDEDRARRRSEERARYLQAAQR
ncbi:MAG: hypothetical protein V2A76_12595, partial [Planctomycetota bacterium]